MRKFFYLTLNLVRIDIGFRGLIRLLLLNLLTALPIALVKSQNGKVFDWHLFFYIISVVTLIFMVSNILSQNAKIGDLLSPRSGRKWQMERKAALSGVIAKINDRLECNRLADTVLAKELLTDILDIIVLHIRDYRGAHNHQKNEVFANILVEQNSDLVVVVRDSLCDQSKYHRPVPVSYPKASLLCGRAIEAKRTLSICHLATEYKEAPPKPYKSILAVPLFSSKSKKPFGCLSVDCARSYFFQSFVEGAEENKMEDTLQPYLRLITMIFEKFNSNSYILS